MKASGVDPDRDTPGSTPSAPDPDPPDPEEPSAPAAPLEPEVAVVEWLEVTAAPVAAPPSAPGGGAPGLVTPQVGVV